MAADQVYELIMNENKTAYMKQLATRYTPIAGVGDENIPGLRLDMDGPHFKDIDDLADSF